MKSPFPPRELTEVPLPQTILKIHIYIYMFTITSCDPQLRGSSLACLTTVWP